MGGARPISLMGTLVGVPFLLYGLYIFFRLLTLPLSSSWSRKAAAQSSMANSGVIISLSVFT